MAAAEVPAVARILQYYASRAVLLWREPEDILAHLNDFLVVWYDQQVAGCVALHDFGNGLYEVRSLAVHHERNGLGLGTALIEGALQQARARGGEEVFALTKKVEFFRRFGFSPVPKERFPQKVWRDCLLCAKRTQCDETAVAIRLSPE